MAYCLIGILDVSLSISYGEGQRAFYRLQVEIVRNTNDWGLFLWKGEPSKYNSAIAAGPECFSRYPADAKAITNIQLMVAADMASEDVWSEWQQFCASNYIRGKQMTVFQYGNRRSIVLQRPGRLHLTNVSEFQEKATNTPGALVHFVKELQVNMVSLSLLQSSEKAEARGQNALFKPS
ncbi:hypothetical protein SERLADRAFT_477644, partial [Serpula lacrymans var. lacrymans S7.9]